jgi:hypothetical protein
LIRPDRVQRRGGVISRSHLIFVSFCRSLRVTKSNTTANCFLSSLVLQTMFCAIRVRAGFAGSPHEIELLVVDFVVFRCILSPKSWMDEPRHPCRAEQHGCEC